MEESQSSQESTDIPSEAGLPDSPFLEGTKVQYAWDSTSLGYLKRCPRLYYYQMILGWQAKEENVHIRFGLEYHKALEDYERYHHEDASHSDSLHRVVKELLLRTADWDSDNPYKNRKTLTRTVIWYLEKFQRDVTKVVVLDTGKIACELSFRFSLDWGPKAGSFKCKNCEAKSDGIKLITEGCDEPCNFVMHPSDGVPLNMPYLLCGHLDRVVTFNDELFVMDRKTTKTTPEGYYFDNFDPENQMSLYTLAGQVLFDTGIRGVIIDAAQVAVGFSRFERGFTYRNPDQIDEWVNDLHFWFQLAEEYAKANYWPMNDTACGMYGGCKFRKICSKSPQVREKFLAGDFERVEPWNPLAIR